MGTTPTYSWPYPESSDFVADGATAIENLADAVDTTVGAFGTWTAYTPTPTNVVFGNGTTSFRYARLNNLVFVVGYFELGSTSSVSGTPIFTLPVTASSQAVGRATNLVQITDTGVRTYGALVEVNATTTMAIRVVGATLNAVNIENVSATNPFTWTTTDIMRMSLTYEAA